MRRNSLVLILLALAALLGPGPVASLPADEGQWLPEQLRDLDWPALQRRGLQLEPGQIWDGEKGLLSAAVNINGCSASFVSPDGLIVTNHHCGYAGINAISTPERNLLADGFVAASREEELRAPGYRVSIVRRIEDVTDEIHSAANAAGDDAIARWNAVERKVNELVEEGERAPDTSVIVTSYYKGREWRRIYRTELRDVRLVYAPPESVGSYGGEVDNWEWPRHTGDFSFFRAYVAPDGSPADYSPDNQPYHPDRWLEVSTEGVQEDDVVLIMGYPGRTERYLTSLAVSSRENFYFPRRLDLYTRIIEALRASSAGDPEAELKLKSRIKSLANSQKNAEGMIRGLARNLTARARLEQEARFQAWVAEDEERQQQSGEVLADVMRLDFQVVERQEHDLMLDEVTRRSQLLSAAIRIETWRRERQKPDVERRAGYRERDLPRLVGRLRSVQRSYVPAAEKAVLSILIEETGKLQGRQRILGFSQFWKQPELSGMSPEEAAAWLVDSTALTDPDGRMELFEEVRNGNASNGEPDDPLLALAASLMPDLDEQREFRARMSGARMVAEARWIEALQGWRGGQFYPDANRTLRVSVATVKGYSPSDGVYNTPHTTVDGMVAKHTGEAPFAVPGPLLRAATLSRDFGRWATEGFDSVPVCFLSDGDTTGGNSGSPVVDGRGRLVGLNFDRVFENVSGDYGWNADRSRNISVDMRYVLWLMEKVWPAPALLEEMGVLR